MSAKYTPGPWVAESWHHEATGQGGWSFSAGGYRLPLCDMEMDPSKEDEPEANARLIAAAPDLLTALKSLVQHAVYDPEGDLTRPEFDALLDQSDAAIAKAEGGGS